MTHSDKSRSTAAIFRERFWPLLKKNAAGLTGEEVIAALQRISDDIYDAGIDDIWSGLSYADKLLHPDSFDLTWMATFAVSLKRAQRKLGVGQ